jgi:retron-type reverse transcriptase
VRQPINWVLDLDVVRCFDSFDRAWRERFLQHRIGDRRLLRLIQTWLKAGVVEDPVVIAPDCGVVQGAVGSPLLSTISVHSV